MFGARMREAWNLGPSNRTKILFDQEALLIVNTDNGVF